MKNKKDVANQVPNITSTPKITNIVTSKSNWNTTVLDSIRDTLHN